MIGIRRGASMSTAVPSHKTIRIQSRSIGLSAVPMALTAAMPKCPLCWAALMSAVGVGSAINFQWLHPMAVVLLLVSVGASYFRARRRLGFAAFYLTLVAALTMYLCKFRLNYDFGVYLSGTALFAASIWNALPKRRENVQCAC